jgi:aerobic carbon-monoxide dehydrogenase medium subunit
MRSFAFHRPNTLYEMSALLSGVSDSIPLAGGMTLLPTIKQRLAAPAALIDLSKIPQMSGISVQGDFLTIGAMTRHVEVAESEVIRSKIPLLASLAAGIGDPAVRNRGTIGGSVANNDPSADYPAACLALNATVFTNKRPINAHDFFTGLFETALAADEIIERVEFPLPEKAGFAKFRNPASRFALTAVFVAKSGADVRVAVTGAGESGVFRAKEIEAALVKRFDAEAAAGVAVKAAGLISDVHGGADYRAHLIAVMAARAVAVAR